MFIIWLQRQKKYEYLQTYFAPAKIQISLRIRVVWSESSLGAFWTAKDAKFLHADNKDYSDCTNVQADLSLCWVYMSKGTFSHVAAQFKLT